MTEKLIGLLSGGLDSPVAIHRMIKSGFNIIPVHFHNYQEDSPQVEKIMKLLKVLSKHQNPIKAYIVPFRDLQLEIVKNVPSKYRMLVYRRIMIRIAERIAKKEEARGFVTGDSLGQVASQTLDNINVVYNSTELPIYHPLISRDKTEIMEDAREIGTYDISIEPYEDCCSFLIAKHPATHASLENINVAEKDLDIKALVKKGSESARVVNIEC